MRRSIRSERTDDPTTPIVTTAGSAVASAYPRRVGDLTMTIQKKKGKKKNRGNIFASYGPERPGKTTTIQSSCGPLAPERGRARRRYAVVSERERSAPHVIMASSSLLYPLPHVERNFRFFAAPMGVTSCRAAERMTSSSRRSTPTLRLTQPAASPADKQRPRGSRARSATIRARLLDDRPRASIPRQRQRLWDCPLRPVRAGTRSS